MDGHSIATPRVVAELQLLGGMVGPVQFNLGDRVVSPLAVAPWGDDPEAASLPGILQRLRGEWPCVPFGIASDAAMPEGWRPTQAEEPDPNPHGYASNTPWRLEALTGNRAVLAIDYPSSHPIAGLRRTVTASSESARLEFELEITARRDCVLPIGIHPTFVLPGGAGSNRLILDDAAECWTPPAPAEPGISTFAVGASAAAPAAVPLRDGGTVDVTRQPLPYATEELLLVTRANGHVRLECPTAGYAVRLEWDPDMFVSCMLWMSNRGRTAYPWNGRFLALGIEPVTAAFDLGTAISANAGNPLAAAGVPTARRFAAGERVATRYAISAEPLNPR